MIIGVDVDNVVYDTTRSVLDIHYENTKEKLCVDDIKSYRIENYISEAYREDFYKIFLDKRVWKGIKLLPHCVDVVKRLHEKDHLIYFITASETQNVHKKFRFLSRTFPFINIRKRLITTQNKQMIKCDVLIDDYEGNLIGGDYQGILMNYPWNANFDDAAYDNIIRVNNWLEIEPVIDFMQRWKST